MLKKFKVTNFKNFKTSTSLVLDNPANYEFNSDIIKNNCITKGLIYGVNGSGKSNLALALFDIVLHLTDKERVIGRYSPYLNLDSGALIAEFEYTFTFDGVELIYRYGKTEPMTLVYEIVIIDGIEVLKYDFDHNVGCSLLEGTETLRLSTDLGGQSGTLSRVKFVKSNALLKDNKTNSTFVKFTTFVDNMLMFYSLQDNCYQGFSIGNESFTQGIIKEGKLKEFENFLKKQGVDYNLVTIDISGHKEIFCKFDNAIAPFIAVASTGTKSLALFYYWFIKMSKASFVYIDEYDAFYHFELSKTLVSLIKELPDVQIFLSTHNTDLLSNDLLRPDAYFEISNNNINSLDKLTDRELRFAHNLQKLYKAGAFNV